TVSVRPVTRLPHENLTGAFIRDPLATDRVFAQVHANRWFPEGPDFDAYITAAKRVLGRVLTKYRKAFGTKCYLRIQTRRSLLPRGGRDESPMGPTMRGRNRRMFFLSALVGSRHSLTSKTLPYV